ncbi:MAG: hypothetical protein JWM14_979 [Chitinophagaceae bacterium]|nr:hypothetical protein [Chitinophagaceae bacterium]
MKVFASLFLVIILLLQGSMKLGIVAYYELNKEYITANFCENKANVSMKCNGKCYLNKKIKAQEQQENKVPSLLKEIKEVLLFVSYYSIHLPALEPLSETTVHMAYLEKPYSSPLAGIFQPPQ